MKIKILLTLIVIATGLCLGTETKKEPAPNREFTRWLARMEAKITKIESKPQKDTTGVAAVRGDKKATGKQLYWKGRLSSKPVTEEEIVAFKEALNKAGEGYFESATTDLKQFLEKHPSSPLISDVRTTLSLITNQQQTSSTGTTP